MPAKPIIIILLVAFVLLAACDPISGDAGTYDQPTPPANHDSEMAAHEWRIEQKQTREAGR